MAAEITESQSFYLWALIRNISHLMGRARDRELAQHGLTVTQSAILSAIKRLGDAATPGSIAQFLYRESTTISNTLIRMEKQNLVNRSRDPMRRREVRVTLTKQGERALQSAGARDIINRTMTGLSEETAREMIDTLEPLRDVLLKDLGLAANRRKLSIERFSGIVHMLFGPA